MGLIPTIQTVIGQFVNPRRATFDFLQLASSQGGQVFGWIDSDGHLQGSLLSGILNNTGSTYINPSIVPAPTLTVTQGGTPGTTNYSYTVFAINGNVSIISSAVVQTTTGNANLNGTNFNSLSWTAVPGAVAYNVYRTASSGTPGTTGTIAASTTALSLNDTGLATLDANSPFSEFAGFLLWNQDGYVGIQNGLQVGVPWTSISSDSPILGAGQFNVLGAGTTVQVNTIGDPDNATNFKTGCLSLTLDGFPNYLTTFNELSAALQIYVQGRVNPGNPSNNYQGIFANVTTQIDSGVTGTGTSIGSSMTCGLQGAGSMSGSEGMFGSLIIMENNLTGTCSDMSAYVAEYATFAASGSLTNFKFFNTHAFQPGGNTVTNAYGFYTAASLATATAFSAAFYTVNQGTGANNYSFYSVGGQNYFGGLAATHAVQITNATAATNSVNQNSPILEIAGTVWSGSVSEKNSWLIQNQISAGVAGTGQTLNISQAQAFTNSVVNIAASLTCGSFTPSAIVGNVPITLSAGIATGGGNVSSPLLSLDGSWWDGAAAHTSATTFQEVVGTGTNPTESLVISNSGAFSWLGVSVVGPLKSQTMTVTAATPTGTSGQVGFGTTTGFGTGTAGTAVTTTTKGGGTGPTNPQVVVNYLEIDIAGVKYWMPLVQ